MRAQGQEQVRRQPEELWRKELQRAAALLDLYNRALQLTEREIFEYALDEAVRLTDSAIGYLHQVNEDQSTLSLTTWNRTALKDCTAVHETHYPLAVAGVWADCARQRRPVVHNDYQGLPDKKGYPPGHTHVVRHLSVPVIDGDGIRLIFGVGNKQTDYDSDDIRQLQSIADELHRIMARRRAAEALAASEARYRIVADNTYDWEFWVGPDGRFLYTSPSCERITGRRAAEFEADPDLLLRLIHPEDRPRFERHRREAHASRRMADEEFRIVRPDGGVRWIGHLCGPVVDEAGRFLGIRGSNRDITERKEAEARLLEYQEQLRSLSSEVSRAEQRERRRIASLLHDDVIQSLALSRIKLGALRDSLSTPEQQAWLDGARALVEQAIQSTRSLTLQLSPPILHELGLEPALDWLTEQVAQQQGISARFASDGQPKPLGEDLKVVLFAATRELLLNVAKHARAANVTVSSRQEDEKIEISVEDDGVGFDPRQTGTRRSDTGGFGLFNIRERLEYLGGCCEVQSEPGRGTRVVLAAPLKPAGE